METNISHTPKYTSLILFQSITSHFSHFCASTAYMISSYLNHIISHYVNKLSHHITWCKEKPTLWTDWKKANELFFNDLWWLWFYICIYTHTIQWFILQILKRGTSKEKHTDGISNQIHISGWVKEILLQIYSYIYTHNFIYM